MEFTSPGVRFWLAQAIEGATRRLRRPECRRLFSDFRDPSGNLLEMNLIRLAIHPADYVLQFVSFADGSDRSPCKPKIAAFTEPGSRVVFVCARHFEKKSRESELQIIHEILHSLGLGENPPSSDQITRQVAARCGGDDRPYPLTDPSQPRRPRSGRTETYRPILSHSLHRPTRLRAFEPLASARPRVTLADAHAAECDGRDAPSPETAVLCREAARSARDTWLAVPRSSGRDRASQRSSAAPAMATFIRDLSNSPPAARQ